jgi:hypothetical protein
MLEQPDLRQFDGTTYLDYQPAGPNTTLRFMMPDIAPLEIASA